MVPLSPDTTTEKRPAAWEQGRALRLAGRPAETVKLLRRRIADEGSDYRLHCELGEALVELNRQEEAIGSFMTALRLKPDSDDVCNKIGSAYASRGLFEPAAIWFARAREMNPATTKCLYTYASMLMSLDLREQAAEVFGQWLKSEPDNPVAHHLAGAALGSQEITKASADYVRTVFDGCASEFDHRLARLNYCAPELVRGALLQTAVPPADGWDILDVGCGTGQVGVALKQVTRRLVGVDLAARMLEMARQRNVYDDLVEADVVDYLGKRTQDFDVITAADVLTYIGEVSGFFSGAAKALRPGGLVVISVEALKTDGDYRLTASGRFSHSEQYLRRIMESSGFTVEHFAEDVMRHEANAPVASWLVVGRSSSA